MSSDQMPAPGKIKLIKFTPPGQEKTSNARGMPGGRNVEASIWLKHKFYLFDIRGNRRDASGKPALKTPKCKSDASRLYFFVYRLTFSRQKRLLKNSKAKHTAPKQVILFTSPFAKLSSAILNFKQPIVFDCLIQPIRRDLVRAASYLKTRRSMLLRDNSESCWAF